MLCGRVCWCNAHVVLCNAHVLVNLEHCGCVFCVSPAGAVVVVALAAIIHYRHHVLLWCVRLDGKTLQDLDSGSSQWVTQHAIPCVLGWDPLLPVSAAWPGLSTQRSVCS